MMIDHLGVHEMSTHGALGILMSQEMAIGHLHLCGATTGDTLDLHLDGSPRQQ